MSAWHQVEIKVSARGLRGSIVRTDPIAVVSSVGTAAGGGDTELGRTERLANTTRPAWVTGVRVPAATPGGTLLRVDFYHKEVAPGTSAHLGYASSPLEALTAVDGAQVSAAIVRAGGGGGGGAKAVAHLSASDVYQQMREGRAFELDVELAETVFYGGKTHLFYTLSRAAAGHWVRVAQSERTRLSEFRWGQFDTLKRSFDELGLAGIGLDGTTLLLQVYRYKGIGSHRLVGHIDFSVEQLLKARPGEVGAVTFTPNPMGEVLSADVAVMHGTEYRNVVKLSLKLVNVSWRLKSAEAAAALQPPSQGR
ncbi:hypothetical protein BU14_0068s0018 [Porphyra umbilicalis]|uniref:C2 domain-containing protein n=1 Tax=Porphyra umbilicalis TaxID=2786 RepID=A0A1X6PGD5_PORUM|nr:hypothetical protein BU14_0068s0018 [Porphyra umbilicalis]|eukprot:OSX79922.1 hypothetical protein BU14_0068s0018 [Porphyra umbilicalis]